MQHSPLFLQRHNNWKRPSPMSWRGKCDAKYLSDQLFGFYRDTMRMSWGCHGENSWENRCIDMPSDNLHFWQIFQFVSHWSSICSGMIGWMWIKIWHCPNLGLQSLLSLLNILPEALVLLDAFILGFRYSWCFLLLGRWRFPGMVVPPSHHRFQY